MNILMPEKYIADFEQLGFGMFVHLGLFSSLCEGEWTYKINKHNMDSYKTLADTFNIKSVKDIVDVAKSAGCKYITLTTRHHEGFSLYDTKGLSEFDIMHTPTGRDVVKEFADECRKNDIIPFFYHTTLDWYNSDFNDDFDKYLDYLYESVKLLCTNYGKIGGLWFDGNWSKEEGTDWKEDRLYKMIHSYQSEALIINNTGLEHRGELGNPEIDAVTYERGLPAPIDRTGHKKYVAGEMCETLCDYWGYANDINYKSVPCLIKELCNCRKVGANFLLNIGPCSDGSVEIMQRAIMETIGRWMDKYGKAIYNGRPFIIYDDTEDFWLKDVNDEKTAYLFRMKPDYLSGNKNVTLTFTEETAISYDKVPMEVESIKWLDNMEDVLFEQNGEKLSLNIDGFRYGTGYYVRVAEVKFK